MSWFSLRNNPIIAGALGLMVTGLGHVYLRRWLRAFGWLAVAVGVSLLLVPESTATTVVEGSATEVDPMNVLPTVLVTLASAGDAFFIARRNAVEPAAGAAPVADGDELSCPYCGGSVDPELEFCHWCTREFTVEEATSDEQAQAASTPPETDTKH